jgi:sugar lactone lactonase YvrE
LTLRGAIPRIVTNRRTKTSRPARQTLEEGDNMQQDRWHLAFAIVFAALLPFAALAWDRGEVERFATLPHGNKNPEGITADRHGNIYVTTFDVTRDDGRPGRLFVFDRDGDLKRTVEIEGSSRFLLDLAFHPKTGHLLVIDFGAATVRKVNPHTGESSVFTTIPDLTPNDPNSGPGANVLTFDKHGNVYISDSFQGVIWRTGPKGGDSVAWVTSPLLLPNGIPPFGANGLAFNKAGNTLFVANTANDQIIKIPVRAGGMAGTPTVFVNSVNGADGLIIDKHGNLWICANQADEIVVLEPKEGRVIAKLGDFDGLTRGGAPRGLLFPASLVRVDDWIYVTNLSLDLRVAVRPDVVAVDSPWAADVKRHTISRLKAEIPPVRGRGDRRDDD